MSNRSAEEIEILLRARYPVIDVVTWEEGRVEEALAQIARRREKKLYLWSIVRGIQSYAAAPDGAAVPRLREAFREKPVWDA